MAVPQVVPELARRKVLTYPLEHVLCISVRYIYENRFKMVHTMVLDSPRHSRMAL
jgi:hypothetical protein